MMKKSVFPDASDRAPTLRDVADRIKAGKAKNIVVMAGAGISTSAGIPDFRSPETGLYANLEKYNLPYPEAIFDISYFPRHPEPFYTLAKELYPGNFEPTLTHYFFRLLHEKEVLNSVWTQNIDTLERVAGLDPKRIIEAHGSFATAKCLHCNKKYSADDIRDRVDAGEIVRCKEKKCDGVRDALIKPDIVFFGEGLPAEFFTRMFDLADCDLLLIMGTSLTVHPFASLVDRVPRSCPRVLINLESVGEDSLRFDVKGGRDVRWLGHSDDAVLELARMLDWEKDLLELQRTSNGKGKKKAQQTANGAASGEEKAAEVVEKVEETVEEVEGAAPPEPTKEKPTKDEDEKDDGADKLADELSSVSIGTNGKESTTSKPSL